MKEKGIRRGASLSRSGRVRTRSLHGQPLHRDRSPFAINARVYFGDASEARRWAREINGVLLGGAYGAGE